MSSILIGSSGSMTNPLPKSPFLSFGRICSIASLTHEAKLGEARGQTLKLDAEIFKIKSNYSIITLTITYEDRQFRATVNSTPPSG